MQHDLFELIPPEFAARPKIARGDKERDRNFVVVEHGLDDMQVVGVPVIESHGDARQSGFFVGGIFKKFINENRTGAFCEYINLLREAPAK